MYQSNNEHDQLNKKTDQPKRLIRIREVIQCTGISKSYIYQLISQNLFPKSIQLVPGGTSVAWIEAEVINWINERISERDMKTVINE